MKHYPTVFKGAVGLVSPNAAATHSTSGTTTL